MPNLALLEKSRRDYGMIPVSVYRSVNPRITVQMGLFERGQEIDAVINSPDCMTFNELISYSLKFKDKIDEARRTHNEEKLRDIFMFEIPCVTIAARTRTRIQGAPLVQAVKHYNSFVVLYIPAAGESKDAKATLAKLPYVFYVTESFTGRGLLVLVPVKNTEIAKHALFFNAIRAEIEALGFEVDERTADVTRWNLMTYDENPYRNDDCIEFEL